MDHSPTGLDPSTSLKFDRKTDEELIKALEEQANRLGIDIKLSYDFPGADESPPSSEDTMHWRKRKQ